MKHIKDILQEVPAVAMMNQNSKVGKVTVNPTKCKAEVKACHPGEFFGCVEECRVCKRKF
jgi:hypothetical protein